MAAFSGILDRIRRKKKEMVLNAQDAYYKLLREVAAGEEVDPDEAAIVIDAAGKTEEDFERDVAIMERRFALAIEFKDKEKLESSVPALQVKLDAANRALADAIQRLQPEIDIAFQQLKDTENRILTLQNVKGKLGETCLDQSLLTREAELRSKNKELQSKRTPLVEDLRHATAFVRTCESAIEGLEHKAKKNPHLKPEQSDIKKNLAKWTSDLDHQLNIVGQLSQAVAGIDRELNPIVKELADIERKKLVP